MKILNENSLAATIDAVNHAHFNDLKIPKLEAAKTIKWISSTYGNGYNGGFGLVTNESDKSLYTFTGEPLKSASGRHIISEEASRAILILNKTARLSAPRNLERVTEDFQNIIPHASLDNVPATFCCGPCTVSVWRHIAAGGLPQQKTQISKAMTILESHQKDDGTWRRFPFYYTILALLELNIPTAKKQMKHVLETCEKKLKRVRTSSTFGERRKAVLERALETFS